MPLEEEDILQKTVIWALKLIATITTLVIIFVLIFPFEASAKVRLAPQAAVEISENLLSSPLTTTKAVFSSAALDSADGKQKEYYAKKCKFGFRAEIESDGKKWQFGFNPILKSASTPTVERRGLGFLNEYSAVLPASVDEKPAVLVLHIYEDTLTQVSCIAERSQTLKRVERIACKTPKSEFELGESVTCYFVLEQRGDSLCMRNPKTPLTDRNIECRHYEGAPVESLESARQPDKNIRQMNIAAFPMKEKIASKITDCRDVPRDKVAGEKDTVASVILCLEEAQS